MFHLFFQTYVASVFAYVFTMISSVFASVSDACFKCFICLQTYVASVAFECFKSRLRIASPSSPFAASPRCPLLLPAPARHPPPLSSLLDASDVQGAWAPCGHVKLCEKMTADAGVQHPVRLNVRTLASP